MQPPRKEALKLAAASEALKFVGARSSAWRRQRRHCKFVCVIAKTARKSHQRRCCRLRNEHDGVAQERGVRILDLNDVAAIPIYVDGADEIDPGFALIKGGSAALTREKIIPSASDCFVCVVDSSKLVPALGTFSLPLEVIPMAASVVCRRVVAMGGTPRVRPHVTTDNGNVVLDIVGLSFTDPLTLEMERNQLPGVVYNGIFARRRADIRISAN